MNNNHPNAAEAQHQLVRQVAQRVYQLMLAEARLSRLRGQTVAVKTRGTR